MNDDRNKIDELIHEALSQEEAQYYDQLEKEQSLLDEGLALFKGKRGWISIYVGIVMVAMMVGGVYCIVEFFRADEIKELLTWGGGFFLTMLAIAALKLYAWMQIDRNAIIREMKRLEFQVSVLVKEVSKK